MKQYIKTKCTACITLATKMFSLYFAIEKIWFKFPQKLRYLLVGGFNTVFGYLLFVFMVSFLGWTYKAALIIGYIISTNVAIFTMRYYVFRSAENLKQEYIKAWGVYLSTMLLNYAAMFVMVDILNINQLGAQAFYTLFSVVFTYIMHKYFSFCRKNQPAK